MTIARFLYEFGLGFLTGVAAFAIYRGGKSVPEMRGIAIILLLLAMVAHTENIIWLLH